MISLSSWRYFDLLLLLSVLLLVGAGVAAIYSAAYPNESAMALSWQHPAVRQAAYALIGLLLMLSVSSMDYRLYSGLAIVVYAASVLSLVVVLVVGSEAYGAKRWIDLSFAQLQPSEFAKLGLILGLAKFFSHNEERCERFWVMLASLGIAGLPAALVYMQPDMGSAAVLGAIWLGMALMAGVRVIHIGILMSVAILSLPAVYKFLLRPYMQERIAIFLDPSKDPLGSGYNTLQSEIGVGSGGFWGKGFLNGTQSQLDFLRVQNTDFIFSVLGEEMGFVGATALLFLFTVLLFRALRGAMISRDSFGRLIATGVVVLIMFQAFINIGVNVRLVPVTGIPLPFISTGGTSLMSLMIAIGIVQSIIMRHERLKF